jgi:hypothetical protein
MYSIGCNFFFFLKDRAGVLPFIKVEKRGYKLHIQGSNAGTNPISKRKTNSTTKCLKPRGPASKKPKLTAGARKKT